MQTLIVCITLSYCYLLLTCIYIVRDYCEIITAVAERRNMEFIATNEGRVLLQQNQQIHDIAELMPDRTEEFLHLEGVPEQPAMLLQQELSGNVI